MVVCGSLPERGLLIRRLRCHGAILIKGVRHNTGCDQGQAILGARNHGGGAEDVGAHLLYLPSLILGRGLGPVALDTSTISSLSALRNTFVQIGPSFLKLGHLGRVAPAWRSFTAPRVGSNPASLAVHSRSVRKV
jgi:hypothetical protein